MCVRNAVQLCRQCCSHSVLSYKKAVQCCMDQHEMEVNTVMDTMNTKVFLVLCCKSAATPLSPLSTMNTPPPPTSKKNRVHKGQKHKNKKETKKYKHPVHVPKAENPSPPCVPHE